MHIKTQQYRLLQQSFTNWLTTLNYCESAKKNYPKAVKELLHYLECQGHTQIKKIKSEHIENFAEYIKKRKNKTTGAGISSNYINNILQAIILFIKYLALTKKHSINIELQREPNDTAERIILSKTEITQLYKACDESTPLGLRDKAMLAIYYGCGLRRNEGSGLDVSDILISKKLIYVRKGKNYKERHVPVTKNNLTDITNYLYHGRDWFLYHHSVYFDKYYYNKKKKTDTDNEAFFLNIWGKRMTDFTQRLRKLQELTNNIELQEKTFGLHTLRHSIATHLLQSGMDIEYIAQFLGHASLESTQIYTHIVNEL